MKIRMVDFAGLRARLESKRSSADIKLLPSRTQAYGVRIGLAAKSPRKHDVDIWDVLFDVEMTPIEALGLAQSLEEYAREGSPTAA